MVSSGGWVLGRFSSCWSRVTRRCAPIAVRPSLEQQHACHVRMARYRRRTGECGSWMLCSECRKTSLEAQQRLMPEPRGATKGALASVPGGWHGACVCALGVRNRSTNETRRKHVNKLHRRAKSNLAIGGMFVACMVALTGSATAEFGRRFPSGPSAGVGSTAFCNDGTPNNVGASSISGSDPRRIFSVNPNCFFETRALFLPHRVTMRTWTNGKTQRVANPFRSESTSCFLVEVIEPRHHRGPNGMSGLDCFLAQGN